MSKAEKFIFVEFNFKLRRQSDHTSTRRKFWQSTEKLKLLHKVHSVILKEREHSEDRGPRQQQVDVNERFQQLPVEHVAKLCAMMFGRN